LFSAADKLYLVISAFGLFSFAAILWVAFSWRRRKRLSLPGALTLLVVLAGVVLLADAFWIEPGWMKIETADIHDSELAQVLAEIRVVQISDIHLKAKGADFVTGKSAPALSARERNLIEQVNALKPDILFITGDFFSDRQEDELDAELEALVVLIRGFKTTTGIYGIAGNYDAPLYNKKIKQKFRDAGIDILANESRVVALPNGRILYLAGIDDSSNRRANRMAFRNIPSDVPVVMLAHDPLNFDMAIDSGVNLMLAGHTHGGQICIPFLTKKSASANKSPYMRGLFTSGKTKMYVNRGIGMTRIPARFLCRPEITLFTITP
jgi:predicted MPP superfamily phosphohydrolase